MFHAKFILLAVVAALVTAEYKIEPRIVQGQDAARGQFPFYVFLQIQVPDGLATCGGSLISDQWVVTAAHCLRNAVQAFVHLGSLKAKLWGEKGREVHIVEREDMFIYPRFSLLFFAWNDIGLIKLVDPVVFNDVIKPIPFSCSPPESGSSGSAGSSGLDVIAIGNGITKDNSTATPWTLQYTELQTISMLSCLKNYPYLLFRRSVICAKGEEKRSVCNGDSGGPLITSDNSLIGITSFGSWNGCEDGSAQVFTGIWKYSEWIKEVSGVECKK